MHFLKTEYVVRACRFLDKDPLGMNLLLQCMRSLELELQISQNELQSVKKKNSNVLRRSFLNDTPIQSKSSAPAFFQTDTILLQSFPRQKYVCYFAFE